MRQEMVSEDNRKQRGCHYVDCDTAGEVVGPKVGRQPRKCPATGSLRRSLAVNVSLTTGVVVVVVCDPSSDNQYAKN